jgi:hypothetical protein
MTSLSLGLPMSKSKTWKQVSVRWLNYTCVLAASQRPYTGRRAKMVHALANDDNTLAFAEVLASEQINLHVGTNDPVSASFVSSPHIMR